MAVDYRVRSSSNPVNGKVAELRGAATVVKLPAANSRPTGSFSPNVLFFGNVAPLAAIIKARAIFRSSN
jgi:hypothetical protein